MRFLTLLPLLALCALPSLAHAIQVCELDSQHVNPANGSTTAGKTGLMRCREGEGGPVVREQELRNGVFMGVLRYFKDGELQREHSVNERGNRDGRSREFSGKQVVSEDTYRNGTTVGLSRRWHPNGKLKRVAFHGEDGREQAVAEFTSQGQLRELRCATQAQLAPDADDATWCGHRSSPASVVLYADSGKPRGSLVHERGERRKSELLWDNGKLREQTEDTAESSFDRSYSEAGVLRRERRGQGLNGRLIRSIEREYHESGSLVRERQWEPADGNPESKLKQMPVWLVLEQRWYLNGMLQERKEFVRLDGEFANRVSLFHDNGKLEREGPWMLSGPALHEPVGVHKRYDREGHLLVERHSDNRGRLTRIREFDESGQVTRDDELYEDGSRKAFKAR